MQNFIGIEAWEDSLKSGESIPRLLYKHTQAAPPLVGIMGGDRCRGRRIALLASRLPWFLGGAAPATAGAG